MSNLLNGTRSKVNNEREFVLTARLEDVGYEFKVILNLKAIATTVVPGEDFYLAPDFFVSSISSNLRVG